MFAEPLALGFAPAPIPAPAQTGKLFNGISPIFFNAFLSGGRFNNRTEMRTLFLWALHWSDGIGKGGVKKF